MSILFSRECEYALRGVLFLALRPQGEMTPARVLSRRLGVPYHFLSKIFQGLVDRGILRSQKGPAGGFALGTRPEKITMLQLIQAIDGDEFATGCVMGFPECSGKSPCPVHGEWGPIRERVVAMLSVKSVAEMAKETKKPEYLMHSR